MDSFKFLPRLIATFYQMTERTPERPIPFTPLRKRLAESRVALLTSGGLYVKSSQEPFDVAREQREPLWADASFRPIPRNTPQSDIGVAHLHINTTSIKQDMNVVLPLGRFAELEADGTIGSLADTAYSVMGYQGLPPDASRWLSESVPNIVAQLRAEAVDSVVLVPT